MPFFPDSQKIVAWLYERSRKGFEKFLSNSKELRENILITMEAIGPYHLNLYNFLISRISH
ncbi:hypothetical protein IX53_01740 [Kosmotoga pacifica]|uniref:Uncharacterized protein n=1 Tax=Kosmotoga pacifica TaxID=1330330 RepID=A0A0G2Z5A8_9BACT|nr:hypothetical protein IX53_01740 [Kosmotoga pacifica]